jgi:Peptidase family M48
MRLSPAAGCFCLSVALSATASVAQSEPQGRAELRTLVDEVKTQLALPVSISLELVPANPLLVSVEAAEKQPGLFVMSFDDEFVQTLTDDELRAVVAHELGHVWIFTHHPYLQTERLANTVAMRVVSRESLERVYAKVWERGGAKGSLDHFLGP